MSSPLINQDSYINMAQLRMNLKRHFKWFILLIVGFSAFAFIYSAYLMPKIYKAQITVQLPDFASDTTVDNPILQLSGNMYQNIASSDKVLRSIIKNLKSNIDYETLKDNLVFKYNAQMQCITVQSTSQDKYLTVRILEEWHRIYDDTLLSITKDKLDLTIGMLSKKLEMQQKELQRINVEYLRPLNHGRALDPMQLNLHSGYIDTYVETMSEQSELIYVKNHLKTILKTITITEPQLPESPYSPNTKYNVFIAIILSCLICFILLVSHSTKQSYKI